MKRLTIFFRGPNVRCSRCSKENIREANFCSHCGLALSRSSGSLGRPTISLAAAAANGDLDQLASHFHWGCDVNEGALEVAADSETARQLIEKGAAVNPPLKFGHFSPLTAAANYGRAEVLRVLLKAGARVNDSDGNGHTPLYQAILRNHLSAAKLLVENGANVNESGSYRTTNLHCAAEFGDIEVIKLLVENGADLTEKDSEGKTAGKVAREKGKYEIVRYLRKNGMSWWDQW